MADALGGFRNAAVELANGGKLYGLNYADDLVGLLEHAKWSHHTSKKLKRTVALFEMCFAPSKCSVLLLDWVSAISWLSSGSEHTYIQGSNCVRWTEASMALKLKNRVQYAQTC